MITLVDTMCYSGGYSLASAVGRTVATPSGGAGSIGVVMMHVSVARALKEGGIDVSLIYAGKRKVDSSPYKELSEEARSRFQAGVDRSYDQFVSLVARNRGIDADAVRATEAMTYDAAEAQQIGLIDAVQEPVAALAAFRKELSGSTTFTGGNAMSDAIQPEAASSAASIPTQETTIVTDTVNQKERISAILTCEESQGRRKLAEHLAFNTDMSAEDAKGLLAVAEKEQTEANSSDTFKQVMDSGVHPNMDAGGSDTAVDESPGDRIARIYTSARN
jgi:ClpP class serine protease